MHHLYGFNVIIIYDKTFKAKILQFVNNIVIHSYAQLCTGSDPGEVDAVHGCPPTMSFTASSF